MPRNYWSAHLETKSYNLSTNTAETAAGSRVSWVHFSSSTPMWVSLVLQTTPPGANRTKHGLSPGWEAAFEAEGFRRSRKPQSPNYKIQMFYTPVPSLESNRSLGWAGRRSSHSQMNWYGTTQNPFSSAVRAEKSTLGATSTLMSGQWMSRSASGSPGCV